MTKKKGIKAFQRLMNVLTIGVGFVTLLILSEGSITISKLLSIAVGWGIILAPNYIIFKTVTIWHSDKSETD